MNNPDNAIEVRNVKKHFKVYYDRGTTLKDKLSARIRSSYQKREVLKGVSFDVKKGEALGLIGKNGCGKSTTLKLLTKIIYPNEGSIELDGRVSSLLELGAGFHPDMNGKENIYMNAAIFGLSRKEIDKRIDDIIKFSELGEFIDNPIRTYSSGMYMRLAFSVAINVDADILMIDEILAVGDISFQKKCFEKLKEIKMAGTTIVIVSHSLDQIEQICDRTIWIEDGVVKEEGKPREIHERYRRDMEKERLQRFQDDYYNDISADKDNCDNSNFLGVREETGETVFYNNTNVEKDGVIALEMKGLKHNFINDMNERITYKGTQEVIITKMYMTNEIGGESAYFETGDDVNIYLEYKTKKPALRGTLCVLIYRDDGFYCYGTNTFIEKQVVIELDMHQYLKVVMHDIPLLSGKYYFTIGIHDERAIEYIYIEHIAVMHVMSNKGEQGVTRIQSDWYLE